MTFEVETTRTVRPISPMEGGPGSALLRYLKVNSPMSPIAGVMLALTLAMLCWIPPAILSAVRGLVFHGVAVPFAHDLATHVRFLFLVPVLVLAEIPIGRRARAGIAHFVAANLVRKGDMDGFDEAIAESLRLRDSHVAELLLVLATAVGCFVAINKGLSAGSGTWYQPVADQPYSPAGLWYVLVSTPISQFLLLRWVYRMAVWTRLLWRISRLDLSLTATHPDQAGGLMFLGETAVPFSLVMFAVSAVISAAVATKILFAGADIKEYLPIYAALIVLAIIIFVGPLLVFIPILTRTRLRGLSDYGIFGSLYTQAFHRKWILGEMPAGESLLGTGDIQSLADLGNSYEFVRRMNYIPIDWPKILTLAVSAAAPAVPLAATVMPLSEIGKQLLQLLV